MRTVYIRTEVDVDVDDVLEQLDEAEIAEVVKKHMPKGVGVPLGMGDGDASRETLIERADLAAKRMADLPREVADLFWHVHGRAL